MPVTAGPFLPQACLPDTKKRVPSILFLPVLSDEIINGRTQVNGYLPFPFALFPKKRFCFSDNALLTERPGGIEECASQERLVVCFPFPFFPADPLGRGSEKRASMPTKIGRERLSKKKSSEREHLLGYLRPHDVAGFIAIGIYQL